jgi:ABC-type uncharacterized transport system permease subunit
MTINAFIFFIAAFLYRVAALGIYFSERSAKPRELPWVRPAVAIGLCGQGYLIYEALFTYGTPHFGMALALSITLFCCTFILFVESFFSRIGSLLMFVLPLAAVSAILPILLPGSPLGKDTASFVFRMHLLLSILSYSLMTLALIQGLMLTALDKWLRAGKGYETASRDGRVSIVQNLPSVIDMEKVLFRLLWIGFLVLTAAIIFGMMFTNQLYGTSIRFDHKTVTTCLAWVIFGILLWGHHLLGWRGRFAARWVVIGFCMLMVSYIGIRLVVELGA